MTTLEQVIAALEKRERHEEAFLYGFIYPLQLMVLHGYGEEEALSMDIDEVVRILSRPVESYGWDNFYRGGHYYGRPGG